MITATMELGASMGLIPSEVERIISLIGREPNMTELGMFAVMWSEHCGYKYSRPILAYFARYKAAMESGGHENAGLIPIGDGLGVAFKVESHNHPSAVEPYQGAATGVGGILRDIFTMGARPIACLNSLRFGPLQAGPVTSEETANRNRYLFEHVVAGIAGYGNCVGVPTVAGEVNFHPRYSGNPLVNAMAVGIVNLNETTTAGAGGIGNPVIYLGSATGKDGIHGATFASEDLGADSEEKRPNVQIGDPFAEKLLIEATLEALKTGAIHSIQDMGAAGLTCSTVEMSAKGGVGMEINLNLVPMRESDMTAYELMLSESQERMLCVAHAGRESEVLDVFAKWGLPAVVIGRVTDSGRVRIFRHGEIAADVDPKFLADNCPVYSLDAEEPAYHREARQFQISSLPGIDCRQALKQLLGSPNIASKRWVYDQYDQQVQTQTVVNPGFGDAAVLAPRGTNVGLAVKIDGNGLWTYLDPYVGGQLAVAEAARNVACTGARPAGITDGLNFGNPQLPHVYWQFSQVVKGIADAADAIGTPVVSGNVSFYNQSDLGEILPTAMIGMLGVLPDATNAIGMGLASGDVILAIWVSQEAHPQDGLGASAFLAEIHGIESGVPVSPNMLGEKSLHDFLVSMAGQKKIKCAHDVSDGGAAVALTEMALAGNTGIQVSVEGKVFGHAVSPDGKLFGEWPGVVFVGVDPSEVVSVLDEAKSRALAGEQIGLAEGKLVRITAGAGSVIDLQLVELREVYEGALPGAIHRQ